MNKKFLETTSCMSLILAAGLLMGTSGKALANPEDGVVAAGSATITSPTTGKLDIHQSSQNVVIDWRSFDIAPNEHTEFHQPSSSSTALNRINSGNASQILGKLSANGNVIIVNQSGIVFGKDAVVDVNGLVATTSNINNTNFMNGNLVFDAAGNPKSAVVNKGTITVKDAGLVGLVAPSVTNSGTITAKLGKVQLASGDKFSVDLYGDGLMNITLSDTVTTQLIENSGNIKAEGGSIELTAAAGANVVNSLVNVSGELLAPSISSKDGKISITTAGSLSHTGTMSVNSDVAGTNAGTITVQANKINNQGKITADSTSSGAAGSIALNFKTNYLDNQASLTSAKGTNSKGGKISVTGGKNSNALVSGKYDVSSTKNKGGIATITTDAGNLKLFGAHVTADGKTGGGTINIGGEYQGSGTTVHSSKTGINYATYLSANATDIGNGGNVIVWSDDLTQFAGHASAKGGAISGNGGLIELSSKDTLQITSNADTNASATNGAAGSLLLDPKNIIVATGGITGGISSFDFVDPNPDAGAFGIESISVLDNGNILIFDSLDDFGGVDAGAAYLFNGATGGLISTLTGGNAGDNIGQSPFMILSNGNILLTTPFWDNGAATDAGAITFINATTGLSGVIGIGNSLVGSSTNDLIGFNVGSTGFLQIESLGNGNYVIISRAWDNGATADVGAVTFFNGTTGLTGAISASNSLIGTVTDDFEYASVNALTNHNYVVGIGSWDNGAAIDAGAAIWGSGTTGVSGTIDSSNSYIGTTTNDNIGGLGITALTNGNYVLRNWMWNNGAALEAGAVTWGNGATGSSGVISAANSIVGTQTEDWVGDDTVTALSNGNFITASRNWANGAANGAGMVYIGDGNTPTSGTISAANAVVGTSAGDSIQILKILDNGKIVVGSDFWDDGATANVGAIRIIDPTHASATGVLSSSNSLVGSQTNDRISVYAGIVQLANDAIVIGSSFWDNGGIGDAGAVTWMDTNNPLVGAVSAANSLVGTKAGDQIGIAILALSNGNYVVGSQYWDNAGLTNVGAVTWMDGSIAASGTVNTSNSLYGSHANDQLGQYNMAELGTSGNYYVFSEDWDNGAVADAGALTWGDGLAGVTGEITSSNSLIGSSTADFADRMFECAVSGSCYLSLPTWDNGAATDAGAVVFFDQNGFSGLIDSTTALVGTKTDDKVGSYVQQLDNGNFLVRSSNWGDGVNTDVGALTWVNGTTGLTGAVSLTNSLVGLSGGDGNNQYLYYLDNNYSYLASTEYDNGGIVDAGAFTLVSTTGPTTGYINSSNSIVGNASGDITIDNLVMLTATTGFMVNSSYDHGTDIDAGAITYFDLSGGMTGSLDESNSIFGANNAGLYSYEYDSVNDRYIGQFENEQRVFSFTFGATLSDYNSYADSAASTITLDPTFITNVLNGGTSVTLQASNDITIDNALIANNGSGNGGTLTLQAGRSILINNDIFTDNGNLNIFGNEKLATGVVNAYRDAGNAVITMANGTTLDAGTGDIVIRLDDGAGKTNLGAGDITLQTLNANTITATNNNATSDIVLSNAASLNASATTGTSILLASGRNFINNSGASVMNTLGSARWLSYSTNPTNDVIGSLTSDFTLFNCTYGGACGSLNAGNGLLYSYNNGVTPPTPTTPVTDIPTPPTVLYVSQTPPPNIINNGPQREDGENTSSQEEELSKDFLTTDPQDMADNQSYSLFNGWVIIDSALVKKLNLLWSQI